jgi:hypothetical protein
MPNPIPAPVPLGPLEDAISALDATRATRDELAAVEAAAAAGIADLDESKATQTALDALSAVVATKAAQADHLALAARVTDVEQDKADKTTVDALSGVVATKADDADLDTLAGRVTTAETAAGALTARVAAVETGKADVSSVTTLSGRVTTLETGAAALAGRVTAVETGKADQTALDTAVEEMERLRRIVAGESFFLPLRRNLDANTGITATFTRPSKAWYEDASGVIREVAEGQPRLRADRGVLIEEARTNRLLWSRDWTRPEWLKNQAIVTRCVGHDGIADTGSRITFTGVGTVIQEVSSLASAARVGCPSIRRESGEGPVEITLDGVAWTQIVPTAEYKRFPVLRAAATGFAFGVRGSGTIDVDFGDVSEGYFALSPVATEGTPLARAADVLSVSTAGWPVAAGRISIRVAPVFDVAPAGSAFIFDSRTAAAGTGVALYARDIAPNRLAGICRNTADASFVSAPCTWARLAGIVASIGWGATVYVEASGTRGAAAEGTGKLPTAHAAMAMIGAAVGGVGSANAWLSDLEVSHA